MTDTKLCPIHRTSLTVMVIERKATGFGCHKSICSLQAGHDGDCEPGDE